LTETGALSARSGEKTGRSPKDKRVVREPTTEKDVWWAGGASGAGGSPNFEMDER
jgi:phosphoenolpyruvate carboxykinase (ATP)